MKDEPLAPHLPQLWSKEAFEAEGFSVSINDPFVGNVCIGRHSDVEHNRNSIQIEMTKGLYMDEVNFEKLECFDEVQACFGEVLARISDYCREQTPWPGARVPSATAQPSQMEPLRPLVDGRRPGAAGGASAGQRPGQI
ncbi:N-formylglutamate amidohydrolase [Marinimicrococcus flavescens]|uniref:Uncharacterized protein n=1 Tax=Marinimicrococcus flavescens TaxID=3031815 RepID=A0AAP3V1B1_9PROT|nr:hypothetical protein [Marinimicrococcus flavescens]